MAPIDSTIRLDPTSATVTDAARARELYKYYQPSAANPDPQASTTVDLENLDETSNIITAKISSPDTALTAFAQLVSWRLGSQRAMISVIDKKTQYFIAESTKTLDLVDNTKHGPGDELWLGCTDVSKDGRLCERTIGVAPNSSGEYRAFVVNDLAKDPRFCNLPFVVGSPSLRFYAGTPLITKRGIPIGSLFVVDDQVRNGLNKAEVQFMGTMAETIMRHLEMNREVEEHRRGMKMSRGLASFVQGRSQLVEADADDDDEGALIVGQFELDVPLVSSKSRASSQRASRTASQRGSVSSVDKKEREYSQAFVEKEEQKLEPGPQLLSPQQYESSGNGKSSERMDSTPSYTGSFDTFTNSVAESPAAVEKPAFSPASPEESEASTLKRLFSRASNLIREAFEIDGGSVFYDAQKGFNSEFDGEPRGERTDASELRSSSGDDAFDQEILQAPRSASISTIRGNTFSRSSIDPRKEVEILGFSTPVSASIHGEDPPRQESFVPFDERSLHALLRRYPRGKLWVFDEDGPVTSSSEEDNQTVSRNPPDREKAQAARRRKQARIAAEARALQRHFPGVRHLLFVPLWDSARSRWLAGNFTWTNETTRILSKQSELAFLTGFCNSVMAECSRLDTEMADQKKSDFIGSISHELRSPLHGIMAASEFLSEEVTEGFSKGLVETIDSCGRTLLDTINHILDFSKINHFEKDWRRSQRRGSYANRFSPANQFAKKGSLKALQQSDLPMINLFAEVDISTVCEEVVESVFAGHVFQNVTAPSFDMVADSRGKMSDKKFTTSGSATLLGTSYPHSDVSVILDVEMQNYHFTTQPGAFRRVIMNLLGNALKYTSHGYVKVKLAASEMDDFQPPGTSELIHRSCLTLTVSDTGKGISSEFIRSKLFTPFAQENSLSSGTGLGLSIVRSIITLLEGNIQIKSEQGRGTEVTVTLPLLREMPKDSISGSTPRSATSSSSNDAEETISQLRRRVIGKNAVLLGFDQPNNDPVISQLNEFLVASLTNFLTNWFGMTIVTTVKMADLVVVNEPDSRAVDDLAQTSSDSARQPSIVLALCSHSSRFEHTHAITGNNKNVGYVIKPVGPLKLARAMTQCLNGVPPVPTPGVPASTTAVGGLSPETSDLSHIFEELSLSPHGGAVLDNSRMAAGSANARKALESPTPVAGGEKSKEFPFPTNERPVFEKQRSLPEDKVSLSVAPMPLSVPSIDRASVVLSNMEKAAAVVTSKASKPGPSPSAAPRLLLVDDNKINLRLLKTCMRKRQYEDLHEAENGLEAVQAFEKQTAGYDIIFMDISMPVLDGFGATRQIRQVEKRRRDKKIADGQQPDAPALVIALTGLASSRDQNEAFSSGVDLFLTKPVSFKEVGKLLDNWQANGARDEKGEVTLQAGAV